MYKKIFLCLCLWVTLKPGNHWRLSLFFLKKNVQWSVWQWLKICCFISRHIITNYRHTNCFSWLIFALSFCKVVFHSAEHVFTRVLDKHVFKCCNYLSPHFSECYCILTMSFSKGIIFNVFYNKTSCFSVIYDLPIEMQQSVLSHRFCKGMAFHQCGLLEGNSKWPLTIKAILMVRLVKKCLHILTAINISSVVIIQTKQTFLFPLLSHPPGSHRTQRFAQKIK